MKDARNIEIDKIATDLNGKMDKDMTNMYPTSNVKAQIANWSFPSDRYIDLELGATNTYYTAPADGYFFLSIGSVSGTQQYANVYVVPSDSTTRIVGYTNISSGYVLSGYVPVKKGQRAYVTYSATGTLNYFRFIYAEGEV